MAVRALFSTVALVLIAGPALASGVIHSANTEMGSVILDHWDMWSSRNLLEGLHEAAGF